MFTALASLDTLAALACKTMDAELIVVSGLQPELQTGNQTGLRPGLIPGAMPGAVPGPPVPLGKAEFTIGRAASASLRIGGAGVAAEHCVVRCCAEGYRL